MSSLIAGNWWIVTEMCLGVGWKYTYWIGLEEWKISFEKKDWPGKGQYDIAVKIVYFYALVTIISFSFFNFAGQSITSH